MRWTYKDIAIREVTQIVIKKIELAKAVWMFKVNTVFINPKCKVQTYSHTLKTDNKLDFRWQSIT